MVIRDDTNKIKGDIVNLNEFKFEEQLAVIDKRMKVASDLLGNGIKKNLNDIIAVNKRMDNFEVQMNEVTITTAAHNEQLAQVKSLSNIESEMLDIFDRQSNLMLHGNPGYLLLACLVVKDPSLIMRESRSLLAQFVLTGPTYLLKFCLYFVSLLFLRLLSILT